MTSLSHVTLANNIANSVYSHSFPQLKDVHGTAVKFLRSDRFIADIEMILKDEDYSSLRIFNISKEILSSVSGVELDESFIRQVYFYILEKSFPEAVTEKANPALEDTYKLYLNILKQICEFQKKSEDSTWQSKYPLQFLNEAEVDDLENSLEYERFVKAFKDQHIYEMMKLNQEVMHHDTLDHICGVHYVAMHVGRQLKAAGHPIDLGRVCGAAAGHDIGKYGCKPNESKRVPYLHYYYTDLWFTRNDIPYIGHIAVNHSAWDLELENLPIESLILIYADFRVKGRKNDAGKYRMHIYNLDESFEVILNKLDNVDEAKERRYKRVYSKLKDFEDFMEGLGIDIARDTLLTKEEIEAQRRLKKVKDKRYYSLMNADETIRSLKHLSISHNINLLHQFRDETSLNSILDMARSEVDWKKLREYIRMMSEYSTYLTQKQKLLVLRFLYDFLTHPEDDIRRQSAELIGFLIAHFDEDYRKELPEDVTLPSSNLTSQELFIRYFEQFLHPDHKIVPLHRGFIGNSLSIMVLSLFKFLKKNRYQSFKAIMSQYFESDDYTIEIKLHLLEVARSIPYEYEENESKIFMNYIVAHSFSENETLRISALDAICSITVGFLRFGSKIPKELIEYCEKVSIITRTRSRLAAENFLLLRLSMIIGNHEKQVYFAQFCKKDNRKMSDVYLDNLKTATPWVLKRSQISLLLDYASRESFTYGFYTAMHFCNLLKVSEMEKVRNSAGEALVALLPQLSPEQRNDVAIELLRALEIEGYQYAEYIPDYLGRVMLYLEPKELDEILGDFNIRIRVSSPQVNSLLLKSLGITVQNYSIYKERFTEDDGVFEARKAGILGMLLNGLVNYDTHVKQVAFGVIGSDIFGSEDLSLDDKHWIFSRVAKKLLTLISESGQEELLFLTNSASLNHLYRFISDYIFETGGISVPRPKKAAFFPGAFDPFSLSHKKIASAIRDLGFEVFLAVDEFSWSKSMLPNLIRKSLINMSIANELNIYLYPENFQTNIGNANDLKHLKTLFPDTEIYIVAGADVLANASAYRNEFASQILSFNHLVFERKKVLDEKANEKLEEILSEITGDIIRLTLPAQFEDISSTQIRNYIDENRDISMLVESTAQKFIYDNGYYQREPQFKTTLDAVTLNIKVTESLNIEQINELAEITKIQSDIIVPLLCDFMTKPSHRVLIIRETGKDRLLGFAIFHRLHSSLLYKELSNIKLTEFIRKNATGKTLIMDGIFVNQDLRYDDIEQILLTEMLAFSLAKDYEFALFNPITNENPIKGISEAMKNQGFLPLEIPGIKHTVQYVSMSRPCTLILDLEALVKEPWRSNKNFKKVVNSTRKKLQLALCATTPGSLVLSFNRIVLWESLIKKVCAENFVSTTPTQPRKLGPYMCVPYGDILSKSIVPNTITKSIHTEKSYTPDMKEQKIRQFPYYLDLPTQLRMLKSFDRPVILVDDLLDRGFRLHELSPMIEKTEIEIKKTIVGILSGKGKELMEISNKDVDSVYYIPKLSIWYNERNFFPFIGGSAIFRGKLPERNMIPSITQILPYCYPAFMKNYSKESVYQLSMTAMEGALEILTVLEEEYQSLNERSLTMSNMGQVLHNPRCPDHGFSMDYDLNLSPSHFLKNDIEHLKRLSELIY